MWINRLVSAVLEKVRKNNVVISPQIPVSSVMLNMFQKGAASFIRGTIRKPFIGSSHGNLFIGRGVKIISGGYLHAGRNVYIGDYSYLDCLSIDGVRLGDHVTIRENCWLQLTSSYSMPGTRINIGNNVYIGPRSILGAGAPLVIGNRCQIGANVSFVAENHDFTSEGEIFGQGVVRKGITLGDDIWIGNNVTILDGVSIGNGSVVGAGTVVTKSVPSRSIVVGVPGRIIKTR